MGVIYMIKHIAAIGFIFMCTTVAWMILGTVTLTRTDTQNDLLKAKVGSLWGNEQYQEAPTVYFTTYENQARQFIDENGVEKVRHEVVPVFNYQSINSSDINVALKLEHRKKGLRWYPTYTVDFSGKYVLKNSTDNEKTIQFIYKFPSANGLYDNFKFMVGKDSLEDIQTKNGQISTKIQLAQGAEETITIAYTSQGMTRWGYEWGHNVSQIKNFNLNMVTNFDEINFPDNSMSPSGKEKIEGGWKLNWSYVHLISGVKIGMEMPQKLNPGPFVSRVSFFAPVSLLLFFFLIFIITTLKKIKIHPMNYFFLACSFFSFHLLMAYLVDHIDVHLAALIASVVSLLLTISYMRLVIGVRFAFIETGIAQLVYLILFSYAFFFEGYTGLSITIFCILTLFIVMQATGRVDWSEVRFGNDNMPKRQV